MKTKFSTILIVILFLSTTIFAQTVVNQISDRNGNPAFVKFDTKTKSVHINDGKVLLQNFLLSDKASENNFVLKEENTNQRGIGYQKYQQYYQNIPVQYGTYIIHHNNGVISSMGGDMKQIENLNTNPTISQEQAREIAINYVNAQEYMWNIDNSYYPYGEIVIVQNDYQKLPTDKKDMVLAYKFNIYATQPVSRAYIYVDAHTGKIVHKNDILTTAVADGSGDTRYSGSKNFKTDSYNGSYRLRDYSRGNGIIIYDMNEGTNYNSAVDFTDANNSWTYSEYHNSAKDDIAVEAAWAFQEIYDYWMEVHNRNSYDGNGALMKVYVHFDQNYDNAYWNGSVFTFGDGSDTYFDALASLDVSAHEHGHAVCSYTCDLTYSYESGALNEAFSDIWGACLENYAAPEKDIWIMGEDIERRNGHDGLRVMSDPKAEGLPDTYKGDNWVTGSTDNGGVHTNNGPFCYWFYLVSEGGSGTNDNGDSYTVSGISIEKAEQITYLAESQYFTSSTNYTVARTYVIEAAEQLYGAGSAEVQSVTNAMYAIGVGDPYNDGGNTGGGEFCTSKGNDFSYEWIAGVEVGDFTKTSNGSAYSDYTSEVITLTPGQSYNVSLTPGFASSTYNEYWKIWIDYNNDMTFSDSELAFDAGSLSKTTVNGTITVPSIASGTVRMRVSMKYNGEQTACETFSYGEVEDYTVTFGDDPGDTQAPTTPAGLSYSDVTTTSVELSWNASTDNVGVTGYDVYKNGSLLGSVTGTSASISSLSPSTTYSFYVKAKDDAGNISSASSSVSVTTEDEVVNVTYCSSQGSNSSYEWIDLVELGSMSNTTGNDGGYADYTNKVATITRGGSETIYISCGFKSSSYTEYWHVWIDFNQNGVFEDSEELVSGSSSSADRLSATMNIPSTALLGTTRMRVTMKYNAAATPCETFSYGEVEDYTVNIVNSYSFAGVGNTNATQLGFEDPKELVSIYPNPTVDVLNVNVQSESEFIEIYNMTGQLIMKTEIEGENNKIEVSDLAPGSYLLKVNDQKEPIIRYFIKK